MKICRLQDKRFGFVRNGDALDVSPLLDEARSCRWPFPLGDILITNLDRSRSRSASAIEATPELDLAAARFRSPVGSPSKIVAAPIDYHKHLDEVAVDSRLRDGNAAKPSHTAGLFLKAVSGKSDLEIR